MEAFGEVVGAKKEVVRLEQLLFAYGGDEFFEVEWLEVGYVLEVACTVGCEGGLEH